VRVREDSGEVRVSRFLGSFDCGRVINSKTTVSQLRGGIVMGIGMALTEETLFDERTGRIMNASLSEYHVPVNLDVPHIEILINDIPIPMRRSALTASASSASPASLRRSPMRYFTPPASGCATCRLRSTSCSDRTLREHKSVFDFRVVPRSRCVGDCFKRRF
jgi:hypothetical protein